MRIPFDENQIATGRLQIRQAGPGETFWEMYDRISPVAIAYRQGGRIHIDEYNSARRLLKKFWQLGRERIQIRGLISGLGSSSPLSTSALNCYLEHYFARQSLNAIRAGQLHRFTWYEIQKTVPISWQR